MIQPHELMEGNYFQWHELASMGRGVDVITPKNHYTYTEFKDPIPLNKEWLIKFGFENKANWYNSFKKNAWILEDGGKFLWMNDGRTLVIVKYVHQLQNLYQSLTGEQLKIKE